MKEVKIQEQVQNLGQRRVLLELMNVTLEGTISMGSEGREACPNI
jgi:hypothetical protein